MEVILMGGMESVHRFLNDVVVLSLKNFSLDYQSLQITEGPEPLPRVGHSFTALN